MEMAVSDSRFVKLMCDLGPISMINRSIPSYIRVAISGGNCAVTMGLRYPGIRKPTVLRAWTLIVKKLGCRIPVNTPYAIVSERDVHGFVA